MKRGLLVCAVHAGIVLSIAGKFWLDRSTLPRAWVRTVNYDPNLPLRGRYVSLAVLVDLEPGGSCPEFECRVRLLVRDGHLLASPGSGGRVPISAFDGRYRVDRPLAYFIPETAPDPSVRKPGEELWVEVSVPPEGALRPIRLGVRTADGTIKPLELR